MHATDPENLAPLDTLRSDLQAFQSSKMQLPALLSKLSPLATGRKGESEPSPLLIERKHRPTPSEMAKIHNSKIEKLPPEIKLLLFSKISDVSGLRALVLASPAYHNVYRNHRKDVLMQVVRSAMIESQAIDCFMAAQSARLNFAVSDRVAMVHQLIAEYQRRRLASSDSVGDMPLDFALAISIARIFHVVQHLVSDYISEIKQMHISEGTGTVANQSLSLTEHTRLERAFFRYEIFCNCFRRQAPALSRQGHIRSSSLIKSDLDYEQIAHLYFPLFPNAWEVEEIGCIREYMLLKYTSLFEIHKDETASPMSSFSSLSMRPFSTASSSSRPTTPSSPLQATPGNHSTMVNKEHLMYLGLPFLHELLNTSSPSMQLSLLQTNFLPPNIDESLSRVFYQQPYDWAYQSGEYDDYQTGKPLIFVEDRIDKPNAGWTWKAGDKTDLFYYTDDRLREIGFVFWDRPRLEEWFGLLDTDYRTWKEQKRTGELLGRNASKRSAKMPRRRAWSGSDFG